MSSQPRVADLVGGCGDVVGTARAWVWSHRTPFTAEAVDRHVVVVDATLIGAHSEKEQASPNFKRGFGGHPMLAFVDHGDRQPAGELGDLCPFAGAPVGVESLRPRLLRQDREGVQDQLAAIDALEGDDAQTAQTVTNSQTKDRGSGSLSVVT